MVAALLNRERLTLDASAFEDGSSELDAQSASNIDRLAERHKRMGSFDGKTLYFIGFSDGVGPSDGNQTTIFR